MKFILTLPHEKNIKKDLINIGYLLRVIKGDSGHLEEIPTEQIGKNKQTKLNILKRIAVIPTIDLTIVIEFLYSYYSREIALYILFREISLYVEHVCMYIKTFQIQKL